MVIVRTGKGGVDLSTGNFLWDDAIIPNALIGGVLTAYRQRLVDGVVDFIHAGGIAHTAQSQLT